MSDSFVKPLRRLWRARRRVAATALAALVAALVAAVWGVCTASAEAPLGPHEARYEVTVNGVVVVDFGPLGTLRVDSPLPMRLGARVVVGEIPAGITEVQPSATLDALSVDAQRYVQFFSDPQASINVAVHALVHNALVRAGVAWAAMMAVGTALLVLLGGRRRRELGQVVRPHLPRVAAVTAGVVVVLVAVPASGSATFPVRRSGEVATVFDGTPLEGARITGRLASVIDTYGGYAMKAYRDNEAFYAGAQTSMEDAWTARAATVRDPIAAEDPKPGAPIDLIGKPVTLLMVSDLHCNTGMAALIERAAELSGATIIVNGGDSTVNGTSVESACVNAFANAAPPGATTVVVDGNHDSAQTGDQERAAGEHVLDGEPVSIDGIHFLGAADPRATRVGSGTALAGAETPTELATRLADTACEAGDIDVLLTHDPAIGEETLDRGCAPLQLSGHLHKRIGPRLLGQGVQYVNASTAGAEYGQPTIGPLRGIAEMTIFRFDLEEHRMLDRRIIRVFPDGHAEVGVPVLLPVPTQQVAVEDIPVPTAAR